MTKNQIVKKNHEFQKILKNKSISSETLVLYFKPNDKTLRVGISVSKKFLGAVGRNKQRRHVREILTKLEIWNKPYDCVLILRKKFLNLTFKNKEDELKKIFERI